MPYVNWNIGLQRAKAEPSWWGQGILNAIKMVFCNTAFVCPGIQDQLNTTTDV